METEQISERKCNCCGEILSATDFPKYPNGKPRSVCLRCRKKKKAEKYRQKSGCSRPYLPRINLLIPLPNERVRELYCNQKNYYVTSLGRIGYKGVDGKVYLYSLHKNEHGYMTFHSNRRYMAHRLVVMAFIGEIPKGMEVNHINGIRDDNRIENLEIVTPKENVRHSFYVLGHKIRGRNKMNNKSSKPVLFYDKTGEFVNRFASVSEASRQLRIGISCIQGVCSGKRRAWRGNIFRYEDNSNTVTIKRDKKGPNYILGHVRCGITETIFFTLEEIKVINALSENILKENKL